MKVLVDATSITPNRSAGVETFAYGLARALRGRLGPDGLELLVRDSDVAVWADRVSEVPIRSVRLRLDAGSRWQSILRELMPSSLKTSDMVRHVRLARARSVGSSQQPSGSLAYYPFHRVPVLRDPSVVTAHDFRVFTQQFRSRMDQKIVRSNVERAKAVVCSWPHPYEDALRLFPEAAPKTFLVPLPVFNAPTPQDLTCPADDDLLLYPASTSPHKNHETLVRAMVCVPKARLLCAGPLVEPEASRLKALAAELGVADRVTFTGFIPEARLRKAFADCTAVIAPTKWEAASGPVYEALAWRKPVIASDIGPIRSQLAYVGASAELFDPNSPDDVARAVRHTLADLPAQRERAREQVPWLAYRSWDDVATDYRAVFRWVLGEGPTPSQFQPTSSVVSS